MLLTLAIEHSNPSSRSASPPPSVAVGRIQPGTLDPNPTILATAHPQPVTRHDDGLLPAVQRACRDARVTPSELQRVAVSAGPGGFTATRIALTAAKTIADATDAELCLIPTARAVALRASLDTPDADAPRTVALAWKRDTVWRERFPAGPLHHTFANHSQSRTHADTHTDTAADASADPDASADLAAGLVTIDQLLDELARSPQTILIADHRFTATLRDRALRSPAAPPIFDARAVLALAAIAHPIDPAHAAPLYPREPEAVTNWRHLHPPNQTP